MVILYLKGYIDEERVMEMEKEIHIIINLKLILLMDYGLEKKNIIIISHKFEEEYLYGYKRKGKKDYKDGNLEYEGEYLYNKQYIGKGMIIRNIIYELINSDGKIKEYDDKGYLRFKGEYLKRNGYGKECNFQMKN